MIRLLPIIVLCGGGWLLFSCLSGSGIAKTTACTRGWTGGVNGGTGGSGVTGIIGDTLGGPRDGEGDTSVLGGTSSEKNNRR